MRSESSSLRILSSDVGVGFARRITIRRHAHGNPLTSLCSVWGTPTTSAKTLHRSVFFRRFASPSFSNPYRTPKRQRTEKSVLCLFGGGSGIPRLRASLSAALDSPPDCQFSTAPLRIPSNLQNEKPPYGWFRFGGGSGIRTHAPVKANGFQEV